jgi:hypothetical protein
MSGGHVYIKVVEEMIKHRPESYNDQVLRKEVIPFGGIPHSLLIGFSNIPQGGFLFHNNMKIQVLVISYPNCMQEENLVLRV